MIVGQDIPDDRLYEPEHIREVFTEMQKGFSAYFDGFAEDPQYLKDIFIQALKDFENERPKYFDLLDRDMLEEFEYDPSTFKGTLRRECPIIRRCLNSPAKVMDKYRARFNETTSDRMLEVVISISEFGTNFMQSFDISRRMHIQSPEDLRVSELDSDPYTAYGMIGGGIRSHFLYNLYPQAFPNRSQNSIWAYYFLTGRKKFGYEDDSEFLMINPDGSGTQQNYFYPYDLFTFYATKLYIRLKAACLGIEYSLDEAYRYVYLNTFLNLVADLHQKDIVCLKPQYEEYDH